MILLAADDSTIHLADSQPAIVADAIRDMTPAPNKPERILFLGWNARAARAVELLDRYVARGSEIQIAACNIDSKLDIDKLGSRLRNLRLTTQDCLTTDRAALERLDIGSFDDVGVLADDALDGDHADSRTLVTLLHLRDMQTRRGERYSIVSEMNDDRHRHLAEVTRADDFVVSAKFVSLVLTQLSENRHLAQVFDVLFDAIGSEIHLKPMEDYVQAGEPITFATVLEAARHRDETAIGYRIACRSLEPPQYGVRLNPDRHETLTFAPDDQIIVLSEGIGVATAEQGL
jgi:hypothetical protein